MNRQRGFTFIEIVVVIAIFSIAVTMITINLGDPQFKRMSHTRNQIASLVQLAAEQAIFNSQDYGITVWQSGYEFLTLTEEGWIPVNNDRIFRSRELPEGLAFDLFLDGLQVNLDREKQEPRSIEERDNPQIFITSDGEISPFRLELNDQRDLTFSIQFFYFFARPCPCEYPHFMPFFCEMGRPVPPKPFSIPLDSQCLR